MTNKLAVDHCILWEIINYPKIINLSRFNAYQNTFSPLVVYEFRMSIRDSLEIALNI